MKCIIVASGTVVYTRKMIGLLKEADLIIAADGGANHLKNMDIYPHVIIGDLDSMGPDTSLFFGKHDVLIISHPARKNKTDTDLCIDFAMKKGATHITLVGVTGHRLDHTLANIFLLRRLSDLGIKAIIVDETNEIHLITDHLELHGKPGELLSIIPVSDMVKGLTLQGVEFPLENATLSMGSSLGVSNYFKETSAFISITHGALIITKSKD